MPRRLSYGRHQISQADIDAVSECLRGDWLTQGPRVQQFEAQLCLATGARHAVAVSSGTAALHLAVLCLGVGPGDWGVTSPLTFVATANALRYVGAEVAFCDVDSRSGLIDPAALRALVERLRAEGKAPKVILPIDFAGQPADLPALRSIADGCGARVIEDAAHSLGASYTHQGAQHRVGSGAHADVTILSFHPVKLVTTGEGGALLTNDEQLAQRARKLRSHGIHQDSTRFDHRLSEAQVGPWYYEQDELGFHYRLSDIQCALGLSQLSRLEGFVERRRALAARYDAALALAPLNGIFAPLCNRSGAQSAHHLYVVQLRERLGETDEQRAARRKDLYLFLQAREIFCQVHYVPVHWQPAHRAAQRGACPQAEHYYAGCLSLPLFPSMTDEELERVVSCLREWSTAPGQGG